MKPPQTEQTREIEAQKEVNFDHLVQVKTFVDSSSSRKRKLEVHDAMVDSALLHGFETICI